jgi:ABC-type nitrate/sulfonate/bicarbonate transport system substrate-binding protein
MQSTWSFTMKDTCFHKIWVIKTIYLLAFLLLVVFISFDDQRQAHAAMETEKLRLGISIPDYPLFFGLVLLARENGFFDDAGLDITYKNYPHGVASLASLSKGETDLAIGADFPFVKQTLTGRNDQIIASIAEVDVLHLIARKDKGIRQPADLKNKRIGIIQGSQLEYCLENYLLSYGLSMDNITVLDIMPADMPKSIIDGTLDAIVFREPMISRIKAELGERVVNWPIQNNQKVYWVVAGTEEYLQRHPKSLKRFIRAIREAELFYQADSEIALDIIQRKGKSDEQLFRKIQSQVEYTLSLSQTMLIALENEARWHIEKNYTDMKKMPNYLNYINFTAMDSICPETVNIVH